MVFVNFGNPIGTETKQLTLAYAFGDGREKSCELTVGALSKLLFGLQIDGYFAVNMDSIPYLRQRSAAYPSRLKMRWSQRNILTISRWEKPSL